MATAHASSFTVLSTKVAAGVAGGLAGGVVFGVLMQMKGMIGMVAQLVGSQSVAVGWLVHLFNSALFGAIFAVVVGHWAIRLAAGIALGMAYGVMWWVLGALLIMPAWLGMNEMIFTINATAWQSLIGHLIYGLILGVVYPLTRARLERH
jgi:hypothetical protein